MNGTIVACWANGTDCNIPPPAPTEEMDSPEVSMRTLLSAFSTALLAAGLVRAAGPAQAGDAAPEPTSPSAGAAVVELFTSEGCSSCPPADRLLSALAEEAARAGRPVFALSFHVDYWDHLGWSDPFGRPAYTDRQKAYAEVLGGGVYTPEMVVNGTEGFVGSDAARARRAVRKALERRAPAGFARLGAEESQGNVNVTFALAPAPLGAVVRLALVQPDTAVAVGRGENGGRTLPHHNVVRAFAAARPRKDGAGGGSLPLPPGARAENFRVIAFAQYPETLEVLGAAGTEIRSGAP
jgi:hypothetical protein